MPEICPQMVQQKYFKGNNKINNKEWQNGNQWWFSGNGVQGSMAPFFQLFCKLEQFFQMKFWGKNKRNPGLGNQEPRKAKSQAAKSRSGIKAGVVGSCSRQAWHARKAVGCEPARRPASPVLKLSSVHPSLGPQLQPGGQAEQGHVVVLMSISHFLVMFFGCPLWMLFMPCVHLLGCLFFP